MIEAIIGAGATVLLAAVGGLIWLIRLEGRVNTQDALRQALEARLGSFEQRIYATLERIENKLDQKEDRA